MTSNAADQEAYLGRIGISGPIDMPDGATLAHLQRQHLLSIPFENLDIHWKRPIVLDTGAFHKKIVEKGRGGFCYELNGLFNELLKSIGFRTRLLSARVGDERGNFSPDYDHAAIMVIIGELEYLADVGFGEFAAEPLRIVPDIEQTDETGTYKMRRQDAGWLEVVKKEAGGWRSQYAFELKGHDLSEFVPRCEYQQYSPDSHFLKGKICSIMTNDGRKTLNNDKFIVTAKGRRTESPVSSEREFDEILMREFGIAHLS
jgi:N-hydroxyarylamine O-acetyltransferase